MGGIRQAAIWEDGLRTDPAKKSFEWWYFDSNLDDGSTLVIAFFTKPATNAASPLAPSIQVVYTSPAGEKQEFNEYYPASSFKASTEKCDVVTGPNTLEGDLKDYKIHIELPQIAGDIEFKRIAPSYSTTEKKSDKVAAFGWFPAIPYGKVKAKFTINDKKIEVKGVGYHDHNWGIINMKDIIKYWYWGRAHAKDYSIVFSLMYLPAYLGGKQASIFYLAKDDQILVGENDALKLSYTNINPPKPTATHLPDKLTFTNEDSERIVNFTFTHPKMIESTDPFSGLSKVKMFMTHLFSKPLYVRYTSDFEIEIEEKGKVDKVRGKGIYEIMLLH